MIVEVDYRGARRELQGKSGSVEAAITRGRKKATARAKTEDAGVTRLTFAYDDIGAGASQVVATLRSPGGSVVRTGKMAFDVPAKPAWLGNDLGKSDNVLPPWTPVLIEPLLTW